MLKKVLLSITFCALAFSAKATHLMSAEITYKFISGDSFEITLKVYRDCNGIAMYYSPILIDNGCTTSSVIPSLISVKDVTGIATACPAQSRCSGAYQYGIEEYIYRVRTRLIIGSCVVGGKAAGCEFTLGWEQCCRNTVITTGAANNNFYVETKLNRCVAPTNSSPEFSGLPTFFLGLGQSHTITNSATDANGDFLTYEQVEPLKLPGMTIPYAGQWTADIPITFLGFPDKNLPSPAGFRFDSLTSNMSFLPTFANEATIISVKVKEWRKISGVLTQIGEVIRDVQVIVVSMPNSLPQFSTANPVISLCDSSAGNYCFSVYITDADSGDTVTFTHKHNIPGATFTNIGTQPNEPVIQVCFPVTSSMIQHINTYQFTLYANDMKCTLPGKNEKTYYLKLGNSLPDSFDIKKSLSCTKLKLTIDNRSAKPLPAVSWIVKHPGSTTVSTNTGLQMLLADTGWHYITLQLGSITGCSNRVYKDSVYISPLLFFSANLGSNDTLHCWADTVTFSPVKTNGTAPFTYSWMSGDSTSTLQWNDNGAGTQTIWVKITDSNNCVAVDSVLYTNYKPLVSAGASASKICLGDSVHLNAQLTSADSTNATYGWVGLTPQQLTVWASPAATTVYEFEYIDSAGCPASAKQTVQVADPQANFVYPDTVCRGDSIVFSGIAASGGNQLPILWDSVFTGNLYKISSAALPYGSHTVQVYYSDSGLCPQTDSLAVVIDSVPKIAFAPYPPICKTTTAFPLTASPPGGAWSGTGVVAGFFSPTLAPAGWHTITYAYTGSTANCSATDSVQIRVVQQPAGGFTVNITTGTVADTFKFANTSIADTTYTILWDFGDLSGSSLANPSHVYISPGTYNVMLTVNNNICPPDSAVKTITVGTLSVWDISTGDIKLYPNPASNDIVLEAKDLITSVTFIDAVGRRTTFEGINSNKAAINISGLSAGIYMVQIMDGHQRIYSAKVLVQR